MPNVAWQPGWEGSLEETRYMCICMAESLHCSPETITALSNSYACMLSHFSHVGLFAPPVARQAPLSMGFSRQEYWSGLPCPPPGDLQIRSDQISRSVMSNSLRPHESQHARLPCPSPTLGVHSDSCPSSR